MKRTFAMLMTFVLILALAACAPKDDANTTTDPVVNGPVHCICGANEGEDHIGDCNGEKVEWTAWTGDTLPTESGYYYAAHEADKVTLSRTNYAKTPAADGKARNIVIDLNGKEFVGPGDMLVKLDAVMTLTITDSSAGHKASVAADEKLTSSDVHTLLYLDDTNEGDSATLNIYRVTLDASAVKDSTLGGTVVANAITNVLNMYGVTAKAGTVIGCGGAIYNDGTACLQDCVVYGAEVTNTEEDTKYNNSALGGAIYTEGDLKLIDCTVYGAAAGRGGALNVFGGNTVMEGGIIYADDVIKCGGAINLKGNTEAGATFTMKSSAKGDPVIDASKNTTPGFGGAINVDGYVSETKFIMESGEIKGGTATGAGGGAVVVQDTKEAGAAKRGIFEMNGGTITGGNANGGCVYIAVGGVFHANSGSITGGTDDGANGAGGICITNTVCELVLSGDAKITGNKNCDIFIEGDTPAVIDSSWSGNGGTPVVVGLKEGFSVFATAKEGVTLTEEHVAFFSAASGTIVLADNTLAVN